VTRLREQAGRQRLRRQDRGGGGVIAEAPVHLCAQSYTLGTQGVGGSAQQGATGPLMASPRPRSLGCGGAAGMPLRDHFAHGEGSGHA
jgi:hypothetical protein